MLIGWFNRKLDKRPYLTIFGNQAFLVGAVFFHRDVLPVITQSIFVHNAWLVGFLCWIVYSFWRIWLRLNEPDIRL